MGQDASNPKRYVIGVISIPQYLPYSEIRSGNYSGFNRELLDLFATQQGYQFEYRQYPIKRHYVALINGQIDFKYPDNPYWSADYKMGHDIHYSDAVVDYTDGVMVRPEALKNGIEGIRVLGMVAGFTPRPYMDRIKSGKIKIIEVFNYEKLLRKTLSGQLDGAYSNIAISQYYLKHKIGQPDGLIFHSKLPSIHSQRHLSSIKHPKIVNEFNQFLVENQSTLNKLKHRYQLNQGAIK
jgi:polar amino acid transport system substrate-binding protein